MMVLQKSSADLTMHNQEKVRPMSVFAKPISQITTEDLQELLSMQAVENVRLEFKRDVPRKDETLKKLSSFANTYGGLMVVGAEANSSDARLVALPGVDAQAGYKQTIVQWCFAGATPPLTAEISDPLPVPGANGKVCYVINIAESDVAPHFLNGRKGVYIRTDEFSSRFEPQLATEHELRQLMNRRQLIRERRARLIDRARERFTTFATRPQAPELDGREHLGSRIELAVVPRFPAAPLCEHTELLTTIREASVAWRQVGFPRNTYGAISQHESAIVLQPCGSRSFFEANIWGMLFYTAPIGERRAQYAGIHTNGFIGHMLVFVRHARLILQRLGYAGALHVELVLHDVRDIPWISFPSGFAETGPKSELDNTVAFTLETTMDDLRQRYAEFASDVLRSIFFAMNWPSIADSPEKLGEIIRTGHEYNFWSPPKV
jgi:hypothetical protein